MSTSEMIDIAVAVYLGLVAHSCTADLASTVVEALDQPDHSTPTQENYPRD